MLKKHPSETANLFIVSESLDEFSYMLKEVPQPQELVAWGMSTRK
jgi:hypothetical protein